MKKLLIFLLFPVFAQAQDVYTIYPENSNNGKRWFTIAAGGNTNLTYRFGGGDSRSKYEGFTEVVCWTDTVTSAGDSLSMSIRPLFWDTIDGRLEMSAAADEDSIAIKTLYAWSTGHSDDTYTFNVSANLPPCDGAQVNVYNVDTGVSVMVRVELRNSRDR